jgi:multiple sugar transport system substrate-binding protein
MHTSRMVALATGLIVALAAPALAQDKVVRVWHTETEPQTMKAFNDIARRFEAKNPGIKIEAEGLAWTDLEGKIMASLAAGSPPELRTASRSPARPCSRKICSTRSTRS